MASPTITLSGSEHVSITTADLPWTDPGASASDAEDGDISGDVTVIGKHPDATGTFTLSYNVTDSDGNDAQTAIRTVIVADTLTPDTYNIEWRPTGGTVTTVSGHTTKSYSLSGLTPGTDYEFRVQGETSGGETSPFSSWTLFTTDADTEAPVITLNGDANVVLIIDDVSTWQDPGATATDNVDGDLTSGITTTGTVNEAIGTYTIDYDVTDSAGNQANTVTRTVEVVDANYPDLVLTGGMFTSVSQGSTWTDPGYTATDAQGTDITGSVTVSGTIDTSTIGQYTLDYEVTDSYGLVSYAKRYVVVTGTGTVPDEYNIEHRAVGGTATGVTGVAASPYSLSGLSAGTDYEFRVQGALTDGATSPYSAWSTFTTPSDSTKPVITLNGDASILLVLSEVSAWTDPGATATDNIDGDITSDIVKTGSVQEAVGTYTLQYDVTDSSGNQADTVTRTVEVVDTEYPTLILTGGMFASVSQGTTWTDPGYTATDQTGTDITGSVQITGTVDTSTTGQYTLHYEVTDSSGLSAYTKRYVAVSNVIDPTEYGSLTIDIQETVDGYITNTWQVNKDPSDASFAVTSNASYTVKLRGEYSGAQSDWSGPLSFTTSYTPEDQNTIYAARVDGTLYGLEVTVNDITVREGEDFVLSGTCNSDDVLITVTFNSSTYETKAVNGIWEVPIRFHDTQGVLLTSNADELVAPGKLLLSGAAQDTGTDGFKWE